MRICKENISVLEPENYLNEEKSEKETDRRKIRASRKYCKKVLGSDHDTLMKKFTDMLAKSMKNVDEDDIGGSQRK